MSTHPLPIAYVAGLFDGEGCVSLVYTVRGRRKRDPTIPLIGFRFAVLLANTRRGVLELLRRQFGGYIHVAGRNRPSHHKISWTWRLSGANEQRRFLTAVAPHVLIKAKAVSLGLRYLDTVVLPGHRVQQDAWDQRVAIYHALSATNQRGRERRKREVPTSPPDGWRLSRQYTPSEYAAFQKRAAQNALRGASNPTAKLTDEQVIEIRRRYNAAHRTRRESPGSLNTQKRLAAEFGVTQTTVHMVVRGKAWKRPLPSDADNARP